MKQKAGLQEMVEKNRRINLIILILSFSAAVVYLWSIKIAYPVFQNSRLNSPLAENQALFPWYYLALLLVLAAAVLTVFFRQKNRAVHFLVLLLAAVMLWYTKYYLAGFTWEPDGPRNLGVAFHIPEILKGLVFPNSAYAVQYPVDYILEYFYFNLAGMSSPVFLHLMPLVNIVVFTCLLYAFVDGLFNARAAFLAAFLAVPGMHYIIFIMGAHTTGLILTMGVLIALRYKGIAGYILALFLTVMVVLSHPISPILLGILLGARWLSSLSRHDLKPQVFNLVLLVICMTGWFLWPDVDLTLGAGLTSEMTYVNEDLNLKLLPEDLDNTQRLTMGQAFLYPAISDLNRTVYFVYGGVVLVMIGLTTLRARRKYPDCRTWLRHYGGLNRSQLFLTVAAPLLLVVAILMSELDPVLMERGLTLSILCIAGVIASIFVRLPRSISSNRVIIRNTALGLLLLFLVAAFPIISFSIDAYSGFPRSEEKGLEFVAREIDLSNKVLSDASGSQIMLFTNRVYMITNTLDKTAQDEGDVIVIRSTAAYYAAMRYDFSLSDNRITRLHSVLKTDPDAALIYISPTVSVYLRR